MSDDKKKINLRAGDAVFYQYDPITGFWGIPNMERDVCFTNLDKASIKVRHNSEGNRDKDVPEEKMNGSILCLGGSHTWGAGVDQDSRYSEHLSRLTGKQVFNLGHCSFGLDQICLVILKKMDAYKPGIIIVEQYPWSIHRILNAYVIGYTRPYFYLDANGNLKLQKMSSLSRFKFVRQLIGSYYAYRKEYLEFKAGINLKDYNPWADPIFLSWKIPYYEYMYKLVDQLVAVMQNYCSQKGIHLLFGLGAIMQQFGQKSSSSLVDYTLPRNRLIAIFQKNNINYIDMTQAMLAEHTADEPVIFHDGHMNKKGHNIFAREIVKVLNTKKWISE